MNNTKETSELSSSKTNMVSTTTILKSNKKGLAVLSALCMMFFYAGRLSVFGGEQSSNVSFLRNGVLESGGGPACEDKEEKCKEWSERERNRCDTNPAYMNLNCPRSCNVCHDDE